MLVIKQAVHIPHLQNHLLHPMQMCLNGVIVNEVAKFLSKKTDETTYALQVIDPIDDSSALIIPLFVKEIVSLFP